MLAAKRIYSYKTGANKSINYSIVILMMIQPFLGATKFDTLQITIEIILWGFLIYGIVKVKLNRLDTILLLLFTLVSIGSFILNDLHTFLLNLKIYGLSIFTLLYYRKVYFNPKKLLFTFLLINILYSIVVINLDLWLIESAWFFEKRETYLFSRPIGFLGTPHATSTCLAIFLLYYFQKKSKYLLQLIILYGLFIYSSWTVFISLILSIVYLLINKFFRNFLHPFLFLSIGLLILFLFSDFIIELARGIKNSRHYSLEIMLPMIFDSRYYQGVFTFFPSNHDFFIAKQEASWAYVGNELGYIKVFVECGILLGLVLLYSIYKRTYAFSLLFLLTLFHYSYFINMPVILYLSMTFSKSIKSSKILNKYDYSKALKSHRLKRKIFYKWKNYGYE